MKELDSVVIMFSGDSGDGMQLTGTLFSNTTALMGNDLTTFPDYPSEIRAPQGTIAGVSGFQIKLGSQEVYTPGDNPDVLVAMNPAALKINLKNLKKGGVIIASTSDFDDKGLRKAGYEYNPLNDGRDFEDYKLIKGDFTGLAIEATNHISELSRKARSRCKNFFALGVAFHMFGHSFEPTIKQIKEKFAKRPELVEANICALKGGRNFAEAIQADFTFFKVRPAKIAKGKYRQVNGNTATAWGLMQAAEASGLKMFLGSYPITPATDILHELSKHKNFGVKTYQAEDEIAGICSAIGASFGGAFACTTTSGPGMALKSEAMGLAVIYELPLVIVNVQRGGPSTGLPTKTEQSDLLQTFYGRNGECPMIILAASRPADCFHMAYEAGRLSLEHMTPVVLLTDGYIANGAEPWRIPNIEKEYPKINHKMVTGDLDDDKSCFLSYQRDEETLVRDWAIPGMKGYEHRIGGLEKQNVSGNVSYDPQNHQLMTELRQEKVDKVVDNIPLQELEGKDTGDVLVVSWGGTYGATHSAVAELQAEGKKVTLCHIRYLNPFPKNLEEILKRFDKIFIPELNMGQLQTIIKSKYRLNAQIEGYHKVQGLPLRIVELKDAINKFIEK